MEVIIDPRSGFCFGVERAIEQAEEQARRHDRVFCLGEIVHNSVEVDRLKNLGIEFIGRERYFMLNNCRVLIRAHGEPPETYQYARENNITLVDSTCPIVLKLQDKIRNAHKVNPEALIVIYGRKDHPEVIGLNAQVEGTIVLESIDEIGQIGTEQPVFLFSQTTRDYESFNLLKGLLMQKFTDAGKSSDDVVVYNSICGQVANRAPWLREFSRGVDVLLFVGGKHSSNSRVLFAACLDSNPQSHFITGVEDLKTIEVPESARVGITGATSTPAWLMEKVASALQ